jgi:protein TonB
LVLFFGWLVLPPIKATVAPPKKVTWIEIDSTQTKTQHHKIVQTEAGHKTDKPTADAFLGWQTQVVDRQTVSKNKRVVMGQSPKQNSFQQESESKSSSKPQNSKNSLKALSKLGVPLFSSKSQLDQNERNWATPGTRPEDSIAGVAEGDKTALNTKEYLFYGYFQRIRERLDKAWTPILRQKLITYYHSGRRLASQMDHTTKVMVVLNKQGEIIRVEIVSESGTRDLDDAAVGAFNKAGPFPNPPTGMVDLNGEVRVPWDFVLKS